MVATTQQTPVNRLIADVTNFQYNPAAIQSAVMRTLDEVSNGTRQIVDPTNPFVFCLESAAVLTAAAMVKNEANTRKQYPFASQTMEDLYLHMSDKDYINRFATPSNTKFNILLPLDEVLGKMVLDQVTGIKKLVIPRNSFFTIININFSIQYPIEIRQLQHGGLQIVYDASIVSPLQTLSTNIIPHEIQQNIDGKYIRFEVDVQQFDIISQVGSLNSATDFKLDTYLSDNFYFARVYVENANGGWYEIKTTHTDQIYDVATPTAVIKVIDKLVTVSIPQIYTGTGMLRSGIRVDIYQTKGPLDLILWEYPFNAFSATWQAYDPVDFNEFAAPLKTFNSIIPYSTTTVSGGSNAIGFNELRAQVISNAIGSPSLPITNAQIESALSLSGYRIVKNIDSVTNRVFLATKGMPVPNDITLITPAAAMIGTVSATIEELVQINSVIDNGESITITPDTIYRDINGIVKPLTSNQLATILAEPVNKMALDVTQGGYLYTPFHYVLDAQNNSFGVRPYYLDNPEINTKLFIGENATTQIQVATGVYSVYRTVEGYAITVVTQSTQSYKDLPDDQCQVQLSFIPDGEKDYAFLNGQFVGTSADGERIYTFNIATNFNITAGDGIELTEFLMFSNQSRITAAQLLTDFNIIYTTNAPMNSQWVPSKIDYSLGGFLLPINTIGVTQETLRVRFGYSLTTLWARSRSVISTTPYRKWEVDVANVYEDDVYERDANGSAVKFDLNGQLSIAPIHLAGDPVLDASNNPTYKHRVGDTIHDSVGNPVPVSPRTLLRQLNIMLIEGAYWFANDVTAVNYRNTITQSVVKWLTNDLKELEARSLDQTRIYFYPDTTIGTIKALVDNGVVRDIAAGQSFKVDLSVTNAVYSNLALREELKKATIKTFDEQLKNPVVSLDKISTALRAQYGTDVVAIQVSGLGGVDNCSVITIMDDSQRCSLRKRLTPSANNSLIVEEDLTINFIKYEQSN